MKVLILNSLYPPNIIGGAEKSVALLAQGLSASGLDVSVCTLTEDKEVTKHTVSGVKVYKIPLDNFYWPFSRDTKQSKVRRAAWHLRDIWNQSAANRISEILDVEIPDVVHTNNITGFSVSVWKQARKRNIKIVHTLRDYSLMCRRSTLFRNGEICERRCGDCQVFTSLNKSATRMVNHVVSNSRYVLDAHIKNGFFTETAKSVIYNISPRQHIEFGRKSVNQTVTFGYIGRIEPEKGIEVVLSAFQQLKLSGWKLLVAGAGDAEYIKRLSEKYASLPVEWLGFVSSVQFFSDIDVSLICSVWPEPLPRTLIESISFGCPAICANAGGIGEIANLAELVGMYDPSDASALASLLGKVLAEPERWKQRHSPSEGSLEEFSEHVIVEKYAAVYGG